jgi:hypothetical protein
MYVIRINVYFSDMQGLIKYNLIPFGGFKAFTIRSLAGAIDEGIFNARNE